MDRSARKQQGPGRRSRDGTGSAAVEQHRVDVEVLREAEELVHHVDHPLQPDLVRSENSKDPGAAAGTEPAQPPLSSIQLMLKSCGKPRNWCITSTTRCSLILSDRKTARTRAPQPGRNRLSRR